MKIKLIAPQDLSPDAISSAQTFAIPGDSSVFQAPGRRPFVHA